MDGSPPTAVGQIKAFPLPVESNCTGNWADLLEDGSPRPYTVALGLGVHPENGRVYATTTCTGPTLSDVVGYIYSFDPGDVTPSASDFQQELVVPLDQERTGANPNNSNWYNNTLHEWEAVTANSVFYANGSASNGTTQHIQPWLGEVAFDLQPDGSTGMMVSDRNRYHDLISNSFYVAGTQLMRACNLGSESAPNWTLEVEGVCGNYTTGNNLTITPLMNFSNTNSKFFGDVGREGEMAAGTITQIPGFAEVVIPATDNIFNSATSGFSWINNQNGVRSRDARIIGDYTAGGFNNTNFRKANNWGSAAAACEIAPLEIGNYVWCDANTNGVQDPSESAAPSVSVQLVCDTGGDGFGVGTDLSVSTTTDAAGYYLFNGGNVVGGVPNMTSCRVIIDNTAGGNVTALNSACGGADPTVTTPTTLVGDGLDEERDSDGDTILGVTGVGVEFTTGNPGDNDHRYDFGFTPTVVSTIDYGDLPDITAGVGTGDYQTLLTNGGASHVIVTNLQIGGAPDAETDGQPNATATGDGADEDGVTLPIFTAGQSATVVVAATNDVSGGGDATLFGYIDFNNDGDFDDTGETASVSVLNSATGSNNYNLVFNVPLGATTGINVGARFRLTTDGSITTSTPNGAASDGEVEDYVIQAQALDYGDLPDTTVGTGAGDYQTTLANSGASHIITDNLYIGGSIPGSGCGWSAEHRC